MENRVRVKVELKGGGTFLGSPKEVVTQMRKDCFQQNKTNIGYKLGLALRAYKYSGVPVRWVNDIDFIHDLFYAGVADLVEWN